MCVHICVYFKMSCYTYCPSLICMHTAETICYWKHLNRQVKFLSSFILPSPEMKKWTSHWELRLWITGKQLPSPPQRLSLPLREISELLMEYLGFGFESRFTASPTNEKGNFPGLETGELRIWVQYSIFENPFWKPWKASRILCADLGFVTDSFGKLHVHDVSISCDSQSVWWLPSLLNYSSQNCMVS